MEPQTVAAEAGAPGVQVQTARARWMALLSLGLFATIAVIALTWAKWSPYLAKLVHIVGAGVYPGHSILAKAGRAGAAPSLSHAWSFTVAYAKSVWVALLAALVISSAIEALLPRRWLVRALSGNGRWATLRGGAASLPTMMCTCCAAPLTATLRREGVSTASALAYWVGNPTLNPAVLAFLAIVAPWQWVVVRLVLGALLVFGLTGVVARLAGRRTAPAELQPDSSEVAPVSVAGAPVRFAKAFARLSVTLLPEYLLAVLVVGLLRGWLFPFDGSAAHWGILAVLLAAVAGTLLVIPTAGEIPILQGLAAIGVGAGVIGTLLITLPAISLPSMAMAGRALSWRVTAALAGAVALTGVAAGGLLWALGG